MLAAKPVDSNVKVRVKLLNNEGPVQAFQLEKANILCTKTTPEQKHKMSYLFPQAKDSCLWEF